MLGPTPLGHRDDFLHHMIGTSIGQSGINVGDRRSGGLQNTLCSTFHPPMEHSALRYGGYGSSKHYLIISGRLLPRQRPMARPGEASGCGPCRSHSAACHLIVRADTYFRPRIAELRKALISRTCCLLQGREMATRSFFEGIEIRDEKAALAFIDALEDACNEKPVEIKDYSRELESGLEFARKRYFR